MAAPTESDLRRLAAALAVMLASWYREQQKIQNTTQPRGAAGGR